MSNVFVSSSLHHFKTLQVFLMFEFGRERKRVAMCVVMSINSEALKFYVQCLFGAGLGGSGGKGRELCLCTGT